MEVILAAEIGVNKSFLRHRVRLELDVPIVDLKKTIETTIRIPAPNQAWFYKQTELDDYSVLNDMAILDNRWIEVKLKP